MKIPYKLIGIGLLAIILVAVIKDRPKEDLSATADIDEELSHISFSLNREKIEKTVDFSLCDEKQSFTMPFGNGTSQLKIIGPQEEVCQAQTIFKDRGGYFINDCEIPQNMGQIIFENGSFDQLSQYCKLKTTGSGLLELD
jgi:hypothetical protein